MSREAHTQKSYFFSLMRVCIILLVALLLPRLFMGDTSKTRPSQPLPSFKLGLENISDSFLKNIDTSKGLSYTVGLITNHTGVDQRGKRNIDILRERGLTIKKIYVPVGNMQGYELLTKQYDAATNIPLVGLPTVLLPSNAHEYAFSDVDVLFLDVQDMGLRPSKCLDMLYAILKSAAQQHKKVVVLDRPNIFGSTIEGVTTTVELAHDSVSLPLQYGMTIGEAARYINMYSLKGAATVQVVPMENYDRTIAFDNVLPHQFPLMTNIDTILELSFLEVLQYIEPFDVGMETDMALRCVLLPDQLRFPKQKWCELRVLLKGQGIETSQYHWFNQSKQQRYSGLRLHITDIDRFSPFNTLLVIIQFFKSHGIKLSFTPHFDRAMGNKKVREFLEGKISRELLEREVNKELKNFFARAQRSFIYKPYPRITFL